MLKAKVFTKKEFLVTLFIIFSNSIINQLLNYILPLLFSNIQLKWIAYGIHFSIFSLGALGSRVILLCKTNSFKVKRTIYISFIGIICTCIILMLLRTPAFVIACRLLQGFFFGIISSILPSIAIESVDKPEKAISIIGIMPTIAAIVGPTIALSLYDSVFGIHSVFYVVIFFSLMSTAMSMKCTANHTAPEDYSHKEHFSVALNKKILEITFLGVGLMIACSGYMVFLSLYAQKLGHLQYTSIFVICSSISGIITRVFLSRTSNGWRGNSLLLISIGVMFGMLLITRFPNMCTFAACGFILGIFSSILMSLLHLYIIKINSKNLIFSNTFFYFIIDISNILTGIVWSVALNFFGTSKCIAISGLVIVCLTLIFYIWKIKNSDII